MMQFDSIFGMVMFYVFSYLLCLVPYYLLVWFVGRVRLFELFHKKQFCFWRMVRQCLYVFIRNGVLKMKTMFRKAAVCVSNKVRQNFVAFAAVMAVAVSFFSATAARAEGEALPDIGVDLTAWVPVILVALGGVVTLVVAGKFGFMLLKKGMKWIRGLG